MRIRIKLKFLIFIALIVSITYQFEDFGLLNAFTNEKKHNKTNDNNSTNIIFNSNNSNFTTPTNSSSPSFEEPTEVIEEKEVLNDDKQKHFIKKTKNAGANKTTDDNSPANYTNEEADKLLDLDENAKSSISESSTKNLRKESIPSKREEKRNLKENKVNAKETKENENGKQLSEEEKNKLCEKLDSILSKLTDFDIKVSQLRADFMNYTKKFLNHHYTKEKPDVKVAKEKDEYLVSCSEKMNDLNQLLQKYKLEIYVLKNKEKSPSKIKNILNDVQTNFLNLITIIKDEIKESKIPLSLLMINFQEKEELAAKADESFSNSLKDLSINSLLNSNQKEEMEDKGNVII